MELVITKYRLCKIAAAIISLSVLWNGSKSYSQSWLSAGIIESVHYDHFYNKDVHKDPAIKYRNKPGNSSGIALSYNGLQLFGAKMDLMHTNYNQDFVFVQEGRNYILIQKLYYYNINFLLNYRYSPVRRNAFIKEMHFSFGPQANIIKNAYGTMVPEESSKNAIEYYDITESYKKLFFTEVLDMGTDFRVAKQFYIFSGIRFNYCLSCDAVNNHGHAVHQVWSKYSFISAYFNDTKILTFGLYTGINYKFKVSDKHYSLATTRR
jgi:hypothetical protein